MAVRFLLEIIAIGLVAVFMASCQDDAAGKSRGQESAGYCQPAPNYNNPQQFGNPSQQNYNSQPQSYQMVGGDKTTAYPGVIFMLMRTSPSTGSVCSGTFVGPNTIFTAAHCVLGIEAKDISVFQGGEFTVQQMIFSRSGKKVKQIITANDLSTWSSDGRFDLQSAKGKEEAVHDFAILITEEDNASNEYVEPNFNFQVADNTLFTAKPIGFGTDESGQPGIKREGSFQIAKYNLDASQGWYVYSQPSMVDNKTQVQQGDSGGALLQNGKLVGVISSSNNSAVPLALSHVMDTVNEARNAGAEILGLSSIIQTDQLSGNEVANVNQNSSNQFARPNTSNFPNQQYNSYCLSN